MLSAPRPHWMFVGDWSGVRASALRETLGQRCLPPMSLPDAISAAASIAEPICAVLVLQSVPDEFSAHDIDRLIGLLPLARWTICVGEWCDSIGRTEQQWPVGWCVPLRDAQPRIALELQRLADGEAPLPPTASRDEAFSFSARFEAQMADDLQRTAFVSGDDPQTVATLMELLVARGARISDTPCDGLNVIATTTPVAATSEQVQRLRGQWPASLIWIATDLITPEQSAELRRCGASAIVSQLRFDEALLT